MSILRPDPPVPLPRVLDALRASTELHRCNAPAPRAELEAAEADLGRGLPEALRALYALSNGGEFLEGNLCLHPLDGAEVTLVSASDRFREWGWPVPDEVLLFGSNGAGSQFGLWLPAQRSAPPLVVELGELFEPGCMAIAGTCLESFLQRWTAYYLLLCGAPSVALKALGVPPHLRTGEADDARMAELCVWADPRLAGIPPDPYVQRLTAAQVGAAAANIERA